MRNLLCRLVRDKSGATAIEYALIGGFLTLCLVGAMPSITSALSGKLGSIGTTLADHN